jgi:aminopeptidase N
MRRVVRAFACVLAYAVATVRVAAQTPAGVEPDPVKPGAAPPPGAYAPGFDALHYDIALELPDTGAIIRGRMIATIALRAPRVSLLPLDFTGLAVDRVYVNDDSSTFTYDSRKIRIPVPARARVGDTMHVEVLYHGHPDDGLLIRPNVHGDRSAFADNWPDRARFWFPCIDHPSDKATVAFAVSAPAMWTLLGNGERLPGNRPAGLRPDPNLDYGKRLLWRWGAKEPIPTYTMVIGAAQFVTGGPKSSCVAGKCVDVSWWSYAQDSASMARSFARADAMVTYFSQTVGPFSYERLAHVESSTRFSGMENATAIFYDEKAIAKGENMEGTAAHETAHQWFGDSVTERDWHDLWLSEGFATYFDALFFQHADGEAKFRKKMVDNRDAYLKSDVIERPVVDSAQTDLFALLNANSYQKGAWVLHMLRGTLGDSVFFRGIRRYYSAHRNGNATTSDLRAAMEATSGRQLGWFFHQWLYAPGYPKLRRTLRWNAATRAAVVTIEQTQSAKWPMFRLPLILQLAGATTTTRHKVELVARRQVFRFREEAAPKSVELDPDARVLMEIVD